MKKYFFIILLIFPLFSNAVGIFKPSIFVKDIFDKHSFLDYYPSNRNSYNLFFEAGYNKRLFNTFGFNYKDNFLKISKNFYYKNNITIYGKYKNFGLNFFSKPIFMFYDFDYLLYSEFNLSDENFKGKLDLNYNESFYIFNFDYKIVNNNYSWLQNGYYFSDGEERFILIDNKVGYCLSFIDGNIGCVFLESYKIYPTFKIIFNKLGIELNSYIKNNTTFFNKYYFFNFNKIEYKPINDRIFEVDFIKEINKIKLWANYKYIKSKEIINNNDYCIFYDKGYSFNKIESEISFKNMEFNLQWLEKVGLFKAKTKLSLFCKNTIFNDRIINFRYTFFYKFYTGFNDVSAQEFIFGYSFKKKKYNFKIEFRDFIFKEGKEINNTFFCLFKINKKVSYE